MFNNQQKPKHIISTPRSLQYIVFLPFLRNSVFWEKTHKVSMKSCGIFRNSSSQVCQSLSTVFGFVLETFCFKKLHTCSIILWSGNSRPILMFFYSIFQHPSFCLYGCMSRSIVLLKNFTQVHVRTVDFLAKFDVRDGIYVSRHFCESFFAIR